MNPKLKTLLFFLIGAFAGISLMFFITNYKIEKRNEYAKELRENQSHKKTDVDSNPGNNSNGTSIEELTNETRVISYIKSNHKLPVYYLTKSEAKSKGWIASKGNLCDVLPGKAIGGDKFSNREKQLPKGDQYYEADVNYNCGNRGADRIVFTEDGEVWLTKNHYENFEKK